VTAIAEELAERLIAARRSGERLGARWAGFDALTEHDAYAVQARVAEAFGPVGGFKVACKPGQRQIMAPILAGDIMASPTRLACPADEKIGIELELGFVLRGSLPPRDAPDRRARLAECVALVPVIEVVRSRIDGDPGPLGKLADNQINGGLAIGAEIVDWRDLETGRVAARLTAGDAVLLDGGAEVPGGDAFENFLALEAMVGDHCGGLSKGQVVITGSLNGLPYVNAPATIAGEIMGVGAVSLALDREG